MVGSWFECTRFVVPFKHAAFLKRREQEFGSCWGAGKNKVDLIIDLTLGDCPADGEFDVAEICVAEKW